MHIQNLLLTILLSTLTLTTAQSFYDFSIYTDSSCSIQAGGIDGETSKNCTILPASGAANVWMQPGGFVGTCEINMFSDKYCVDQVSGTTSPPNLGCVSTNGGKYYTVGGC